MFFICTYLFIVLEKSSHIFQKSESNVDNRLFIILAINPVMFMPFRATLNWTNSCILDNTFRATAWSPNIALRIHRSLSWKRRTTEFTTRIAVMDSGILFCIWPEVPVKNVLILTFLARVHMIPSRYHSASDNIIEIFCQYHVLVVPEAPETTCHFISVCSMRRIILEK